MNVVQYLEKQAASQPHRTAIVTGHGGHTAKLDYGTLANETRKGAAFLQSVGLCKGDGILVMAPPSIELYVAVLSCLRLGCHVVFIDPDVNKASFTACTEVVNPVAYIGSPRAHLLRLRHRCVRTIPIQISLGGRAIGAKRFSDRDRCIPFSHLVELTPETPAITTFTSGTTGAPKALCRTHGFLENQHDVLRRTLPLHGDDTVLCTLPIFALSHLANGMTVVLPDCDLRTPGTYRPDPIFGQIEQHGVTAFVASPAFMAHLALSGRKRQRALSRVQTICTGGGPVFPRLMADVQALAPEATVFAVYGSSEAEPIAHLDARDLRETDRDAMNQGAGILAGTIIDAIRLRIITDRTGPVTHQMSENRFDSLCLPAGQVGEIVVSGAHVVAGYLDGIGDRENKIHTHGTVWHRTGDAGRLDGEGRLWLLGRCSARLEDTMGRIYPFGLECAMSSDPRVERSALVPLHRGRVLAVQLAPGTRKGDFKNSATPLTNRYGAQLVFLPRIPTDRRHNSKVDRPALLRLLQSQSSRIGRMAS